MGGAKHFLYVGVAYEGKRFRTVGQTAGPWIMWSL